MGTCPIHPLNCVIEAATGAGDTGSRECPSIVDRSILSRPRLHEVTRPSLPSFPERRVPALFSIVNDEGRWTVGSLVRS
jgi:hypothetical protein